MNNFSVVPHSVKPPLCTSKTSALLRSQIRDTLANLQKHLADFDQFATGPQRRVVDGAILRLVAIEDALRSMQIVGKTLPEEPNDLPF